MAASAQGTGQARSDRLLKLAVALSVTAFLLAAAYRLTRDPPVTEPGTPVAAAPSSVRPPASPPRSSTPGVAAPLTVLIDPASPEFAQLVRTDPASAAAALAQSPDGATHDRWLLDVMANWLAVAPRDAVEWTASLPAGDFKAAATEDLYYTWANSDAGEAAATLEKLHAAAPPGTTTPGLAPFVNAWALRDPLAASRWLATLDPPAPARSLAALANTWVARDPAATTAWAATLSRPQRDQVAPHLVTAWANTDPGAALDWLHALPSLPETARRRATLAALATWAGSDNPAGAVAWLDNLPDTPDKTKAVHTVATGLAETDPHAAVRLATTIEATPDRTTAITEVYDRWLADDTTGQARHHLADTLTSLPTGDPAQVALRDVLYRRDPEFRQELLERAANPPDGR